MKVHPVRMRFQQPDLDEIMEMEDIYDTFYLIRHREQNGTVTKTDSTMSDHSKVMEGGWKRSPAEHGPALVSIQFEKKTNGGKLMTFTSSKRRRMSLLMAVMMSAAVIWPGAGRTQVMAAEAAAGSGTGGVPPVLITEIVPNSADAPGTTDDAYEYFEIYNNSNRPMDLKDYQILYRYPTSPNDDAIWTPEPESVVIKPGKSLIFWLWSANSKNITIDQFNAHYGTNLELNKDVVRVSAGLHSSRTRWIIVATKTGHELVSAAYNDGVHDASVSDMGVIYRYPDNGSNEMIKTSSGTIRATPGFVEDGQVPGELVMLPEDTSPPVLSDQSPETAEKLAPVTLSVSVRDDSLVKTVNLHYRTDREDETTTLSLKESKEHPGLYEHTFDGVDLLGSTYIEYHFEASDGLQTAVSAEGRTDLVFDNSSPRLSLNDGELLKGETWIKAAGDDLEAIEVSVDGEKLQPLSRGLEQPAYFAFDVNGADKNYLNAVKFNGEIIHLFNYGVTSYNTVLVPVDGLAAGTNTIRIAAGSYTSTYDGQQDGNLDDYDVRNVRLLLADGTELRDPAYSDPAKVLDMGDNGRFLPVVDFKFDIAAEKAKALLYKWDTKTVSDGAHEIGVLETVTNEQVSAEVLVDNEGPVIQTSMEEKLYKGPFEINATFTDTVSSVDNSSATLDGQSIELPYAASSASLEPGEHTLQFKASDASGNQSESTITFTTEEEHPSLEMVGPANGSEESGTTAALKVKAEDPSNDAMTVSFYEGDEFRPDDEERVAVFTGAADTEPPAKRVPGGERQLSEEEIRLITSGDEQYLTEDSLIQFPYLRYEMKVDEGLSAEGQVEFWWKGRSLEGRKVTLYAWNNETSKWEALDSLIAPSQEAFELTGSVPAGIFTSEGTVNFLVQDQIEVQESTAGESFSFMWLPDTQYYTQTFSHIFDSQVEWIRDHAEEYNVKYVFHTGDIVENYHQEYQWENGDRTMSVLEGAGIPFGVAAGNHDVSPDLDYTMFSKYFGEDRFKDRDFYGESYKNNRGHYDLISAGGTDYIMLYMGWGIGSEEIRWMNQVLKQFTDRKAILAFHDYVQADGQLNANGKKILEEVVKPNRNVFMVINGHYTGSALNTAQLDDDGDGTPDRKVYQILSDYQGLGEGGDGYLKMLLFNPADNTLEVKTYSPYKDDYNYYDPEEYPDKDELTLDMDLTPQLKRVATDAAVARLYSTNAIGSANVESGQTAETLWEELQPNRTYFWYAAAEDQYGGRTLSELWRFSTGEGQELAAPVNLQADEVTDNNAVITWEHEGSDVVEVSYDVYLNGEFAASVTESVYRADHLSPDTEYTFTVIAKAEGIQSERSEALTIHTKVNMSVLQQGLEQFIKDGEVRGPLAKQLENALKQAEHQMDKGDPEKAKKHISNFLKHLNQKPMEKHVSPEAKAWLQAKADAFLAAW